MTIDARKLSIAQKLFNIEEEHILIEIEALLNQYENVQLNDELKSALDKGISDIESGKYLSHKDAMEIVKKRNPKYF